MSLVTDQVNLTGENSVKLGNAYRIPLLVKDANKNPLPLTGFTGKSAIKKYHDGAVICAPTVAFMNRPLGVIHLVFDGRETRNLKPGKYLFDVFVFDPENKPLAIVEGTIEFTYSCTEFS